MSLKDFREGLHDTGYDKEAAYFRKQEQELVERLRKKKEAEEAGETPK